VGLSAKNAILIVEFAKENHDKGMELIEATVHAARQRLRPILMTSLAFMFGVLPLAISSGAGSGGQNAIGTGVIGGMLSATVVGHFLRAGVSSSRRSSCSAAKKKKPHSTIRHCHSTARAKRRTLYE